MAIYDVETILDDAMDLTTGGQTAKSKDTGAPHEDSWYEASGASEGHQTYLRLTVTDDVVGGGDDVEFHVLESSDDTTFAAVAKKVIKASEMVKGKAFKLAVPPGVARYIAGAFAPGGTAITGGTAQLDLFHG